jgi:hypothetical protein
MPQTLPIKELVREARYDPMLATQEILGAYCADSTPMRIVAVA